MNKSEKARDVIGELRKRIDAAERERKEVIDVLQDLKNLWLDRDVNSIEYNELASEKIRGKTLGEWIEYYDNYIADVENKIEKAKDRLRKNKIVKFGVLSLAGLIFLGVLMFSVFYFSSKTVIQLAPESFVDNVGISFNGSGVYEWVLGNYGELERLGVSGGIEGEGEVRIYLGEWLILDSSNLQEILFSPEFNNESNENESENRIILKENASLPQRNNGSDEDELNISTNGTVDERNESLPGFNITGNETVPDVNVSEGENEDVREKLVREFFDACEETCDLSGLGLNESSYVLRIEIDDGAILNFDSISYSILSGENIEPEINETAFVGYEEEGVGDYVIQYNAVAGERVKWMRIIQIDENSDISEIALPVSAEQIRLKEGAELEEILEEMGGCMGEGCIEEGRGIGGFLLDAVQSAGFDGGIRETSGAKILNLEKNVDKTVVEKIGIEYVTAGVEVSETGRGDSKTISVNSVDGLEYSNVLISTDISEILEVGKESLVEILGSHVKKIIVQDKDGDNMLDYVEWESPVLGEETFEISIKVLNVQSYPTVGGSWIVDFLTLGNADLFIRAINETTWSNENENEDLKFLEVRCGNNILNYSWENNEVVIRDYSCEEIGHETSIVVTPGVHNLEFEFGGERAWANNFATFSFDDFEDSNPSNWGWTQVNYDDCDWSRNPNGDGTPSGSTGPEADHTLGTINGHFLFIEASSNQPCGYNQGSPEAILESPVLDADLYAFNVSLWYHMYGSDMGSLHLDVNDSSGWHNDVWSISGQQQSTQTAAYLKTVVDLSSYTGLIKLRIRSITGTTGFRADAAIDDVNISYEERTSAVYNLTITNPTASAPEFVSDGDNITISFDLLKNDINVTSDVVLNNITIGGVEAPVVVRSSGSSYSEVQCGISCNMCNQPGSPLTDNCEVDGVGDPDTANCGGDGSDGFFFTNNIWVNGTFEPGGEITIIGELDSNYPLAYYVTGWQAGTKLNEFGCYDSSYSHACSNPSGMDFGDARCNVTFGKGYDGGETGFGSDTTISTSAIPGDYNIRVSISYQTDCNTAGLGNGRGESDGDFCEEGNHGENDGIDITIVEGVVEEYWYSPIGGWQANVSVPSGLEGPQDLFVNASGDGGTAWNIESGSIIYGLPDIDSPYVSLNKPENETIFELDVLNITLNASVFDDNDGIDVRIYGVNSTSTGNFYSDGLLYQQFGVNNGSEITYNWTSPVTVPSSDIFSLWHFDNVNAFGENDTNVYDFAGGEHNLTVYNGTVANMEKGKFGGAFEFDGMNDFMDDDSSLSAYPFTFSAWVNVTGSGERVIMEFDHTTDVRGTFGIRITTENYPEIYAREGNFERQESWNVDIEDGKWHHIAGVFVSDTNKSLYVDGDYKVVETLSSRFRTFQGFTPNRTNIGVGGFLDNEWFSGFIDEAVIWNRTLNNDEIKDLYRLKEGTYYWKVNVTDSSGNNNESEFWEFDIAKKIAPEIHFVESISSVTPISGGLKDVVFKVTVDDANGYDTINDTGVWANFTREIEPSRSNSSCSLVSGENTATSQNFSCSVGMWYWDEAGEWNVSVYAEDDIGLVAVNNSTSFVYETLNYVILSSQVISFALIPGEKNQTATSGGIFINNSGNAEGTISVMATDLYGTAFPGISIGAGNFTANSDFGGDPPLECSSSGILSSGSFVEVLGSSITRGNVSEGIEGQESIFMCAPDVPLGLLSDVYSTSLEGAWEITILLVAFVAGGRRKKKRKPKIEEDKLFQALGLMTSELREKYDLSEKELMDILGIKQGNSMPLCVFSKKLGGLEAVVKYMKENLGMGYSEIAKELARNDRTIWTAYKKAREKDGKRIVIIEEGASVPIKIFKDRTLTVLEAVVVYLRNEKKKFKEIAILLKRDQRNVQTIYSRAVKKI